jgi:hypothetical protein
MSRDERRLGTADSFQRSRPVAPLAGRTDGRSWSLNMLHALSRSSRCDLTVPRTTTAGDAFGVDFDARSLLAVLISGVGLHANSMGYSCQASMQRGGRQIARRALYRDRLRTELHNARVGVHSHGQDFYLACNSLGSELLKSMLVQAVLRSRCG